MSKERTFATRSPCTYRSVFLRERRAIAIIAIVLATLLLFVLSWGYVMNTASASAYFIISGMILGRILVSCCVLPGPSCFIRFICCYGSSTRHKKGDSLLIFEVTTVISTALVQEPQSQATTARRFVTVDTAEEWGRRNLGDIIGWVHCVTSCSSQVR